MRHVTESIFRIINIFTEENENIVRTKHSKILFKSLKTTSAKKILTKFLKPHNSIHLVKLSP
jgi:hypothetical protein